MSSWFQLHRSITNKFPFAIFAFIRCGFSPHLHISIVPTLLTLQNNDPASCSLWFKSFSCTSSTIFIIKKKKEVGIDIAEGTNPEVYTEKHEKLMGDCETASDLYVDGYDEDGDLIYDPIKREKCYQCGYITISQLTSCNKCELPQGQLCGDCLYTRPITISQLTSCNNCELPQGQLCGDCLHTRYGENVREVDFNPKWTCPYCREICNCNSCRRKNGWMPTGNIYN